MPFSEVSAHRASLEEAYMDLTRDAVEFRGAAIDRRGAAMTTTETTAAAADVPAGRDRFDRLLRAEWTKFTTVRGWVVGLVAAAVVTVLLALPTGAGEHSSCGDGPQCAAPVGPDGGEVSDSFYFVRQPLTGDGSITVRVTSLTGARAAAGGHAVGADGRRRGAVGEGRADHQAEHRPGIRLRGGDGHRRHGVRLPAQLHARHGGVPLAA